MATIGPINNMDMSEKIYQDLKKLGSKSRQTNNKRITSAHTTSTKSSYHISQCSSATCISNTPRGSIQGLYTDLDIVKSKSWSGSKGRSNQFSLNNSSIHKPRQSKKHSESLSLHSQITDKDLINNHSTSSLRGKGHFKPANNHWPDNSSQVLRLQQEWAALDHCRAIKRASEMVQHRLDPMYCLSGSNVPLLERYHINEAKLEDLRKISVAGHRQLADYRRLFDVPDVGAAVPSVHCKLQGPCNTPAHLSYSQSEIRGSETPVSGSCLKEHTGCKRQHVDFFLQFKHERESSQLMAGNANTDIASLYNEAPGSVELGPAKTDSLKPSVSLKNCNAAPMPVKPLTISLQKNKETSLSPCSQLELSKENQKKCVLASKKYLTQLLQAHPSTDARKMSSNPAKCHPPLLTGLCKGNSHQNRLVPYGTWKFAQTFVWVDQSGFVSSLANALNEQLGHWLYLSESYGNDPFSYRRRVDACANDNTNQSAAEYTENADSDCHYCQNSTCEHKNGMGPLCVNSSSATKTGLMTDKNLQENTDSKVRILGTGHARGGSANGVEISSQNPEAVVLNAGMEEEDHDYICSILASEVYQDVLSEDERCNGLKHYPENVPQHLIPYFRKTSKNDLTGTYEEFERTGFVSNFRDESKKVRKSLSAVSVVSHSKSIASAYKAFKEKKTNFSWSFPKNANVPKSSDKRDLKQGKITGKSEEDLINRTARTVARMSKKSDLSDDKHKPEASYKSSYIGKPLDGNSFKPGSDLTCKPTRISDKSGDNLTERPANAVSRSLRQSSPLQPRVLGLQQTVRPSGLPLQHGNSPVRQSDSPLQQKTSFLRQSNSPLRQGALHNRQSHSQHGSLPLRQFSLPLQQGSLTFSQSDLQVLSFGQSDSSLLHEALPAREADSLLLLGNLPVKQSEDPLQHGNTAIKQTNSLLKQTLLCFKSSNPNVQQSASQLQSGLSLKQPVAPSQQPTLVRFEPPHTHSLVSPAQQSASPFKRTAVSFRQKPSTLNLVTSPVKLSQNLQQASSHLHTASSAKILEQSFGLKGEKNVLYDEAKVNRKLVARSSASSQHNNLIHLEPELQQPSYFKVTGLQNKMASEKKSFANLAPELVCIMTQADQPLNIGQGDQQQWPEALTGWPESVQSIQQFLASEQHLHDRYSGVNSSVLSSRSLSGISSSRTSMNLNHEPFRPLEHENSGPEQLYSVPNSINNLHSWESCVENKSSFDTVSSHLLNSTADKFQQKPNNKKPMASCHPVPDIETAMFFHCGRIRPSVKPQKRVHVVTKSLSENWKSYQVKDNRMHRGLDCSNEMDEQSLILSANTNKQSSVSPRTCKTVAGCVQSASHMLTSTLSAGESLPALSPEMSDSKQNCFDEKKGHVSLLCEDLKESDNLSCPNSIASVSSSVFDDSLESFPEYYYDANDHFVSDDDDEVEDLEISSWCSYEPSVQSSEGFIPRRVEDNFSQLGDDCLKKRHLIFPDDYITTRASEVNKTEQRKAEKEIFNVDRGLESKESSLTHCSFENELNPQFGNAKMDCDLHFCDQDSLADKLSFEEEIINFSDSENAVSDLVKTSIDDFCNVTSVNKKNSHGNLLVDVSNEQKSHFNRENMNCSIHSLPTSAYMDRYKEVIGAPHRCLDYFENTDAQNQNQGNLRYNYGQGIMELCRAAAETLSERLLAHEEEVSVDKHSEQPVKRVRFLAAGNAIDNAHARSKDGFNSDSKHSKSTEVDHFKGAIISKSPTKLLSSLGQSARISMGCRPMSAVLLGKSATLLRRGACVRASQSSDCSVYANGEKAERKNASSESKPLQTASLPCCASCAFCVAEKLGANIETFMNEKTGSEKANSLVSWSMSNEGRPARDEKHSKLGSDSILTNYSDNTISQQLSLRPKPKQPLKVVGDEHVIHTLRDLNQTSTPQGLDLHLDLHSLLTETSDKNETPQQSSWLDSPLSSENSFLVKSPLMKMGAEQLDGSLQSCESESTNFIKQKERFLGKTAEEASLVLENRSESATTGVERLDLTFLDKDVSPMFNSQSTVNASSGNKSQEDKINFEHKNVSQSARSKSSIHASAAYSPRDTEFGKDILSRASKTEKLLVPTFKKDYDLYSHKASTPELKRLSKKDSEVTETEAEQALHSLEIPGTKTLMTKIWVKEKGWPTSCVRHLEEPLKVSSGNQIRAQYSASSLHGSSSAHISMIKKVPSTQSMVKPPARSKSADPSRQLFHSQYKGMRNIPDKQQTNKFASTTRVKPCLSLLSDIAFKPEKKVNTFQQPQVSSLGSRHTTNKPQVNKSILDVSLAQSFSAPLSSVRSKGQIHGTGPTEVSNETKSSVVAKFKLTKQNAESARIKVKLHNHQTESKKQQVKTLNHDPQSANIQVKSSYKDSECMNVKIKSANKSTESTKHDMAKADPQKMVSQASIETKFSSTCTEICEDNSAHFMKPGNNRKGLHDSSQSLPLNTDFFPSSFSTNNCQSSDLSQKDEMAMHSKVKSKALKTSEIPIEILNTKSTVNLNSDNKIMPSSFKVHAKNILSSNNLCQSSDLPHKDEMARHSQVNSKASKASENPIEILNTKSKVSLKSDNTIMPSSFKVHAKNIVSQISIMTHGVSATTSGIKPCATVNNPPVEKSEPMCLYTPRKRRHPREQKPEPKTSRNKKTLERLQHPKGTHPPKKFNTIKKRHKQRFKKKRHKDDRHCDVNGPTKNGAENVSADLAFKLNKTIAELDRTLEELDQTILGSSGDTSIQITSSNISKQGSADAEINTSIKKIQSFYWNSGKSARSVNLNQDASSICRSINISQINQIESSDMVEAKSLQVQGDIKKKPKKRRRKRKHSKKITKPKKLSLSRKKRGKVSSCNDSNLPASLCHSTLAQANCSMDGLKTIDTGILSYKRSWLKKKTVAGNVVNNTSAFKLDDTRKAKKGMVPACNSGAGDFAHPLSQSKTPILYGVSAFPQQCIVGSCLNQDITVCFAEGEDNQVSEIGSTQRGEAPNNSNRSAWPSPNVERSATPHYVSQAPSMSKQLKQHQLKTPSSKLDPAQNLIIEADKYFDKFVHRISPQQQADTVSEDSQSVCGGAADKQEKNHSVPILLRPGCSSWEHNSSEPCTCFYRGECCGSRVLVCSPRKGQIEKGLPSTKAREAGLQPTRFEGIAQLNRLSPPTLLYPRSPVISPRRTASCSARSPVLDRPHSPTLDPALQLLDDVDQYFRHLTERRQKWEEASQRLQNMLVVESSAAPSVGQCLCSGTNPRTSCTNCANGKALAGRHADKDSQSQGESNLSDFDQNESHTSRSENSFSDPDDTNGVFMSSSIRITDHAKSNGDRSRVTFYDHFKNGYIGQQPTEEEKPASSLANGKRLSKSAAYPASTPTKTQRGMQWTGVPRYSEYSQKRSTCNLPAADSGTARGRGDKRGSETWPWGGKTTPQIDWLDTFGCGSQRSIVETYRSACKMHTLSSATAVQGKERARPSSAPVLRWNVVDPSQTFLQVRGTHICSNANIIKKKVSESEFLIQKKIQMKRIAKKF